MHYLPLAAILTVSTQICSCVSQAVVTSIPMVIQLPSPMIVQAEVVGEAEGLTTYLLHDPPNPNTEDYFTIGGTITYIVGPTTASARMVNTQDGASKTVDIACSLEGTNPGNSGTCTARETGGLTDVATETVAITSLAATIGSVSTASSGFGPSATQPSSSATAQNIVSYSTFAVASIFVLTAMMA